MKKYKIDRVVNERWAVWYMEIPKSRNKLGMYRIIDLYSGTRETRFAPRWKVKGDKTQEVFDNQLIFRAIRNFYKDPNQFQGTSSMENQTQSKAA